MKKDSLGNRMKEHYEKGYKQLEPTCVAQACMNDFLVELSK